jgi:SAM-dependent methyltransferase
LAEPARDSSVLLREKEFWDQQRQFLRVRRVINRALGAFNRSGDIHDFYDPRGKTVLDYGCGNGFLAFRLLEGGAREVVGIDISEGQVEEARARAAASGATSVRFEVADAHQTGLPSSSFDLIVGIAILHHLDLERALPEIRRLLQPGGSAVFLEPLWHNPLLRLGRALTPSARTSDEHPFTERDWETCAAVFPEFRHFEREFVTIPLMPFNLLVPESWQRRLARRLFRLDDRLLARWPSLRKHCRSTILVLE